MEVGSRYPPGHSNLTDYFALTDLGAFLRAEIREMKVHRIESTPVIQNNAFPAKEKLVPDDHLSVIRCNDIRALRRLEVDPPMGRSRGPVDDPAQAKRGGNRPGE
jgi:hypothetical protein